MNDDDLRHRFARLRREDAARAEPFERVLGRARARAAATREPAGWVRRGRWAVAAAVAVAAISLWTLRGEPAREPDFDASTLQALGRLRTPTDALLDIGVPTPRGLRAPELLRIPGPPSGVPGTVPLRESLSHRRTLS